MIETITVSTRGQIVIPEKMRAVLGIRDGSRLVLVERDNEIIVMRESEVEKSLKNEEKREDHGWMMLAEKSLKEVWDNPKDEKIWLKYRNLPSIK